MTTARTGAEYKKGDSIVIKAGLASGKMGKITMVAATQGTIRGTEERFIYKTTASPEYYRAKDLQKA